MSLTDPADKTLDAVADGAFGGKQTVGTDCNPNRRAGYGDQLEMILRIAKKGGTLAAGEGLKLIEHYEALVQASYWEGRADAFNAPAERFWETSNAKASL